VLQQVRVCGRLGAVDKVEGEVERRDLADVRAQGRSVEVREGIE